MAGRGRRQRRRDAAAVARLARSEGRDPAALRREVAEFRLALEADLTVAAAAADHGANQVAADVLAGDRAELDGFQRRVLTRVRRPARRPRRRTAAVATTAALLGAAGGVAVAAGHRPPTLSAPRSSTQSAPAVGSVAAPQAASSQQQVAAAQGEALATAARAGLSADQISAYSSAFTASVTPLLAQSRTDPAVARALWTLLTEERALLRASDTRDPAIAAALAATESLLRDLQSTVPAAVLRASGPPASTPSATRSTPGSRPATTPASTPAPAVPATGTAPPPGPGPSVLPLPSPSRDTLVGLG